MKREIKCSNCGIHLIDIMEDISNPSFCPRLKVKCWKCGDGSFWIDTPHQYAVKPTEISEIGEMIWDENESIIHTTEKK